MYAYVSIEHIFQEKSCAHILILPKFVGFTPDVFSCYPGCMPGQFLACAFVGLRLNLQMVCYYRKCMPSQHTCVEGHNVFKAVMKALDPP